MEALERMPFTAQRKIFKYLAQLADRHCLTQEEQEKYDESRKAVDDYNSGLYGSYIIGFDEGEEKGIAKGMAQGMAKGELNKSLAIAKKMLLGGMSDAQVMQFTGLTQAQLDSLKS